jgi:hypothetical protein
LGHTLGGHGELRIEDYMKVVKLEVVELKGGVMADTTLFIWELEIVGM